MEGGGGGGEGRTESWYGMAVAVEARTVDHLGGLGRTIAHGSSIDDGVVFGGREGGGTADGN